MSGRVLLTALALGLLVFAVDGGAARAAAARRPSVEIGVIYATRTDGGTSIDPKLRDLPQLTREQPFVRYNVYQLLERTLLPLEASKPVTSNLVNGRTLLVTLVDVAEDAGEKRFHIRAEINDVDRKTSFLKLLEVTASADQPFFLAGQTFKEGKLFIEIVVRP